MGRFAKRGLQRSFHKGYPNDGAGQFTVVQSDHPYINSIAEACGTAGEAFCHVCTADCDTSSFNGHARTADGNSRTADVKTPTRGAAVQLLAWVWDQPYVNPLLVEYRQPC